MIDRPQQPAREAGKRILLLTVKKGRNFANWPRPRASTGQPAGPCHTSWPPLLPPEAQTRRGHWGGGELARCHLPAVSGLADTWRGASLNWGHPLISVKIAAEAQQRSGNVTSTNVSYTSDVHAAVTRTR